jgi:hypothetical protein
MKFYTNVKAKAGSNKIFYSGYLDLEKEVFGPLELSETIFKS